MNRIFVLCGMSSCGKDTVYKRVKDELGILPVVSTTSRPMRPKETEGVEYYFVSPLDFLNMEDEKKFIETRYYNTIENGNKSVWYYGISKDAIDLNKGNHIVIVDLKGLIELKKEFKDSVISIYLHVDEETRVARAMAREGFEKEEWERRLEDDKKQFSPQRIGETVDYMVHNLDLDKTVCTVKEIIKSYY